MGAPSTYEPDEIVKAAPPVDPAVAPAAPAETAPAEPPAAVPAPAGQ